MKDDINSLMYYKIKEFSVMRKLILLFAALAIVFANVDVKAQCPPGYTSYVDDITYDGCSYKYYFCLGIN